MYPFNNNTKYLVITTDDIKYNLLKLNALSNNLMDIVYITPSEFSHNILFDITDEYLLKLYLKYNKNPKFLMEIKKYLYFIDSYEDNEIKKFLFIQEVKDYLSKENVLTTFPMFLESIKSREIVVYNIEIDDLLSKALSSTKLDYTFYQDKQTLTNANLISYQDIYDEVDHIFFQISKLINEGTDINNIYIHNTHSMYSTYIELASIKYNLPININKSSTLLSFKACQHVLAMLDADSLENKFVAISEYIDTNISDNYLKTLIQRRVINILLKYRTYSGPSIELKELIKYEFSNSSIRLQTITNAINVTNITCSYIPENSHVFIPGLNKGVIYSVSKETDFLTREEKVQLGMHTNQQRCEQNINRILNSIKSCNNVYLSYFEYAESSEYFVSELIDELKKDITITHSEYNNTLSEKVRYSYIQDSIDVSKSIFSPSDLSTKTINSLYSEYSIYDTYNNEFTGLNKDTYDKYHPENKHMISHSSISKHFECQFKFYLNSVLKVRNKDIDKFTMNLGNILHYVLKLSAGDKFNSSIKQLLSYKDEYITGENLELTSKEQYFVNKNIAYLLELLPEFAEHLEKSSFDVDSVEEEFTLDLGQGFTLLGDIDKVLINNDSYVIVDYKSSIKDLDQNKASYGLSNQLLIYSLLLNKAERYKMFEPLGFYFQRVTQPQLKEGSKSNELQHKLHGITIKDDEQINQFTVDSNMNNIKGLKQNKSGEYKSSALISKVVFEKMIKVQEELLQDAIKDIKNLNFVINPKDINGVDCSCTYCDYSSICFKKYKDIKILKPTKITSEEVS